MTKDEALKLALEALQNASDIMDSWAQKRQDDAITAIKEALAQPEQKSVAMADYMVLTEKYVALKSAVLTEREACAKECEGINSAEDYYGERPELVCAEAIRARGQT